MNVGLVKLRDRIFILLLCFLYAESVSAQVYSVTDLGDLPGGTNSQAYAISNDGVVVGSSSATSDADYNGCGWPSATKPFIWTAAGGMQVLGPPPVHDALGFLPCSGGALGINDHGEVVGYLDYGFAGGTRGFIWSTGNGMQLIYPPQAQGAMDINNAGQVVGPTGGAHFDGAR